MSDEKLRPRDRDALLQALRAGVVPLVGIHHIQVGRRDEVTAMLRDVERVADGGAAIRFVIGDYGAGKTFFLNLVRSIAHQKKLVSMHADLTPDRRLHSSDGKARALVAELTRNTATRSKPEGGALPSIVERFVSNAASDAAAKGADAEAVIQERLAALNELVGGYDFAAVIGRYWQGHQDGNEQLKSDAIRWLRAEFSAKTDARNALGVRSIVDDRNFYDHVKLLARFVKQAGYGGLLVCVDEMVNLYRIPHSKTRQSNYEQILRLLNDALQGIAGGLGILFGGTTDFLLDPRRGLYSYEALQSRLAQNEFAKGGLVDHSAPVLRLEPLTQEDFLVLLRQVRTVFEMGNGSRVTPDTMLVAFMDHCRRRLGDLYFRTPRTVIVQFLNFLSILEQNPQVEPAQLLNGVQLSTEKIPDTSPFSDASEESELKAFQL